MAGRTTIILLLLEGCSARMLTGVEGLLYDPNIIVAEFQGEYYFKAVGRVQPTVAMNLVKDHCCVATMPEDD